MGVPREVGSLGLPGGSPFYCLATVVTTNECFAGPEINRSSPARESLASGLALKFTHIFFE